MLLWIVVIIVILVLGWLWMAYNGLIKSRNRTDEALSDINVQMKRRFDLIPNIVEAVKGYAAHEKTVLEDVTKARTAAMGVSQNDLNGLAKADNQLSATLKSLFAVAENYPDLKANQNFLQLQQELVDTEDKIQASRRFYNANVRDFNTEQQVFPTNLFAKALGFSAKTFFEVDNEAAIAEPVAVKF
ncbi:MAG TPA: LemA family protein [Candidatus Saccharimonadales bacterium]|nr:LemA family protein [Candidatus Saccharimonadales bacterium]